MTTDVISPPAPVADPQPAAPSGVHRAPAPPSPGAVDRPVDIPDTRDPRWARPALVALLGATAVLYLWGLGASGWANTYYSAAAQAAATSWKAFLFGSTDAANFITVDKAPGFLWPMGLAARLFGVNAWSILVPQALEGVAAVGLLYLAVKRWFGPAAGLLAGAVLATTPVAALMFRFNNPDALLVLLLVASAYAMTRALDDGATRWVVLAGAFVGFGWLAKMLQAFLVVPALGLVYLVAAPTPLRRRIGQLLLGGAAMVAAFGWWAVLVTVWPTSSRPYIGGSQDNTLWNLVFGYNGFGRLNGNESGSVGGQGPVGSRWGQTGWTRLFNQEFAGQASWLLPAALVLLVGVLALTVRAKRTDRTRAAMVLWGGWLVVTGLAISLGRGIIHPYYTVALGPALGAVIGIGAVTLWRRRSSFVARAVLAGAVVAAAWYAHSLLGRTPGWHPQLRTAVLVGGVAAAIAIVGSRLSRRPVAAVVAGVAVVAGLAGQGAYALSTASQTHSGAIPSAGPRGAGFGFGPGGRGPGGGGFRGFPGANGGTGGTGGTTNGGGLGNLLPGMPGTGGTGTTGTTGGFPGGPGGGFGGFGGRPNGGFGGGGILSGSTPSAELTAALREDASTYRWVAAVISANQAAGYQLASGEPVMAMGGFNGTDPAPSLEQFLQYVADRKIHYFIASGGGFGAGGSGTSAEIASWVEQNFTATTVGGVTLYDLTTGAIGTATSGTAA